MKLLIGSHNPSKLKSLQSLFAPEDDVVCLSPLELHLKIDVPESAHDAAGNARQKALAYHQASGFPVLAEDSGLLFLDLPADHPDQPGVHVRRMVTGYVMENDEELLRWYQAIAHRHGGKLRAAWQDAYCLVMDAQHIYCHTAAKQLIERYAFWLVDTPCTARNPGWPLNSLSVSPYTGRYFAETTWEEHMAAYDQAASQEAEAERDAYQAWVRRICCAK